MAIVRPIAMGRKAWVENPLRLKITQDLIKITRFARSQKAGAVLM